MVNARTTIIELESAATECGKYIRINKSMSTQNDHHFTDDILEFIL